MDTDLLASPLETPVCSLCCDDLPDGLAAGSCTTCPTGSMLCVGCFEKHVKGKGHFSKHLFMAAVAQTHSPPDDAILAPNVLHTCPDHPGATLRLVCNTCRNALLCSSCIPSHSGHALEPIASAASAARRRLDVCINCHVSAEHAASGGAGGAPSGPEPLVVACARARARCIADALDAITSKCDAALQLVDSSHDALIVAALGWRATLRARIEEAARDQQAAGAAALEAADALLQHAEDVAAQLQQVRCASVNS
jgi:hypothetical protein